MYKTILLGLFSLLPGILAEPVNATSHVFDRSPGFGEKLIAINPSIDYQDISPNISKFRVSGFDFFSDGRLAISLWDAQGRVYILENPQAPLVNQVLGKLMSTCLSFQLPEMYVSQGASCFSQKPVCITN